jgi:2-dehydro-3-deoxyphosphogluconate aldolase/(4S)-4-hydroxy-2-oxoglutarate aldolase
MNVAQFKKKPMMGIVRGLELAQIEPLVEAVIAAGLETLEIAMNTAGAVQLIRMAREAAGRRLVLGAGTVLDMTSLGQALDAGATFVVMPVLIPEVLAHCIKNKVAVFPGALTVQEIYRAWNEGATMVKVFPIKFFGPQYIKEVKGPFADIELLACAGVTAKNMREFFACGANAIAFGSSVFKKEWLEKGDYSSITAAIEAYAEQLPFSV